MGLAFYLVVLYIMTASTKALSTGDLLLKRMEARGEDGNNYLLSINKKLDEEDVDLSDSDGNMLSTTEFFNTEGFYIQKPANQNICNLVQLEKKADKPLCYQRQEVSKQNLTEKVVDHCRERKIYVLVSSDAPCTPAKDISWEGNSIFDEKRKRSVDIGYLSGRSSICKTETVVQPNRYCCAYFLWWCSNWCTEYKTKTQTVC